MTHATKRTDVSRLRTELIVGCADLIDAISTAPDWYLGHLADQLRPSLTIAHKLAARREKGQPTAPIAVTGWDEA